MSKLEFDPSNPNEQTVVHSPEGDVVRCTVANAHDLVRLNGYFWKAEEAVAAKAVEDAVESLENAEKTVPVVEDTAPTEPTPAPVVTEELAPVEKPKRGRQKSGA